MDTSNQDADSEAIPDGYHRHTNPDGSIGGLVSDGARVGRSAYVGRDAIVEDLGEVLGHARILDRARVTGRVQDEAVICDNTIIERGAIVAGRAVVSGQSVVDRILVDGYTHLHDIRFTGHSTEFPGVKYQGTRFSGGEFQGIAGTLFSAHLQLDNDDSGRVKGMSLFDHKADERKPLPHADELLKYVEYPFDVKTLKAFPSSKMGHRATGIRER